MEVTFLTKEQEKRLDYKRAIKVSEEYKKVKLILTPTVFEDTFFDFESKFVIWYGSRVSAKSYYKAIQLLYKCVHAKYFRCLFTRQTQKDARDSQFQLLKDIITKFYPWLQNEFLIKESTMMIVHIKTGHFLKGASFEEPIRSLAEYTDLWVEEPITRESCIDRSDLLDIMGTLRNSFGVKSQIHLTFNPISDDTFIYLDFFSSKKVFESTVTLANYGDNPFCPTDKIEEFQLIKLIDPERYEVDALGKWGTIKPDKLFFYNYDAKKHEVENIEVNDNLPICLSFDFNVTLSCLAGQVSIHDKYVRKIKEWHDSTSNMDIPELIQDIVTYFGKDKEYLITGDASGNNRSAFTKGHASGFSLIFTELEKHNIRYEDHVPSSNPSHYNSKIICNSIFKIEQDLLYSQSGCPTLLKDIKKMEQDSSGGYNKKLAEAKNYGHMGDCDRYFNHVFLYDLWQEYVLL